MRKKTMHLAIGILRPQMTIIPLAIVIHQLQGINLSMLTSFFFFFFNAANRLTMFCLMTQQSISGSRIESATAQS
jgi:hypothetical protein